MKEDSERNAGLVLFNPDWPFHRVEHRACCLLQLLTSYGIALSRAPGWVLLYETSDKEAPAEEGYLFSKGEMVKYSPNKVTSNSVSSKVLGFIHSANRLLARTVCQALF